MVGPISRIEFKSGALRHKREAGPGLLDTTPWPYQVVGDLLCRPSSPLNSHWILLSSLPHLASPIEDALRFGIEALAMIFWLTPTWYPSL